MATINWFPGHMAKAKREISEKMPSINLIIEILDARIPFSSENPLVESLRKETPCLKILNKSDLADPEKTKIWLDYYNAKPGITAIALTQKNPKSVRALLKRFKSLASPSKDNEINAMILGIPNVGKSSTINTLANRTIAKTGDEPAVTKRQQRIALENDIILWDTPGFLWPKLEPEECAYRLAVTGAIKASIIDFLDVACFLIDYLVEAHPQALSERFGISADLRDSVEIMDAIAIKRNHFNAGKTIDYHKVSEVLLTEYRHGKLGELSLESPDMIERELAAYEIVRSEKEAKKRERQNRKDKKPKKR